ncbi:hypothetical protein BWI96_08340 [Siphonobacter sp. SORGH_AS_0500]|uniref:hypothetical protein n=1 Tax=Siphonobacter sp. SORGH_AS_0500 TaxID=1864824 RepID=UPI000CA9B9A2|nr:hypothetical protein [Siphonobacter sp. SORGH_AS_0500]PKK36894.1 hypothetical protein BWI96_08340 [Siphonobacter sp. SORGH_AS_0500]
MKRLLYVAALLVVSQAAMAQDNSYESLSRLFSQTNPQGSARMQAMGGTHTAIGADVSNISGNPAGLGFYTRSELSISPMFSQRNNSSQYINSTQNANANQFALGNFGVVFAAKTGILCNQEGGREEPLELVIHARIFLKIILGLEVEIMLAQWQMRLPKQLIMKLRGE